MSVDLEAREATHNLAIVLFVAARGGTKQQANRLDLVFRQAQVLRARARNVDDTWDLLEDGWREVLAQEPQVDTEETPAERLRWLASQLPSNGDNWWAREDMVDVVPMVAEIIGKHFWGNAASAREEAQWIIGASPTVVLGLIDQIDALQAQVDAVRGRTDAVLYLADNTKSCGGATSDSEGCHVRDLVVGIREIEKATQ